MHWPQLGVGPYNRCPSVDTVESGRLWVDTEQNHLKGHTSLMFFNIFGVHFSVMCRYMFFFFHIGPQQQQYKKHRCSILTVMHNSWPSAYDSSTPALNSKLWPWVCYCFIQCTSHHRCRALAFRADGLLICNSVFPNEWHTLRLFIIYSDDDDKNSLHIYS